MGKNNTITIKTYNEEHQIYADTVATEVKDSIKTFIDTFLKYVAEDSLILEIGSGTGRDALYIEKAGYRVLRTDAAKNFVNAITNQGHHALVLDIINETLDEKFGAIFANAVFLHFDDTEFDMAIQNVLAMLRDEGIFAFSVHKGTFQGISSHKHSARYFREWTEEEILLRLTKYGFKVLEVLPGESISKRKAWIMIILQKPQE